MQHPQQGASTHRPLRLRVKRDPVEKAMPYDTALPLLQESASAEASEGASPHRSTQSGQCTAQPDRARESVPVLAGTRHPQPAQSAGYLLERGLFRVCMVCFWFGVVLGLSATPTESFRGKFAKGVWFVSEKPD